MSVSHESTGVVTQHHVQPENALLHRTNSLAGLGDGLSWHVWQVKNSQYAFQTPPGDPSLKIEEAQQTGIRLHQIKP